VLVTLHHSPVLLQPPVTGQAGEAAPSAPEAGGGQSQETGCMMNAAFLLLTLVLMYFLLIRPQRKQQKEHEDMLSALKKGAIVRTSGGIRGEIFDLDDREATLIIADKTKINILRSNIAGIEPAKDSGKDKKT